MRFSSDSGDFLELRLNSYEFAPNGAGPDDPMPDNEWDLNWLVVDGSVSWHGVDWEFRHACLTTFEAYELRDWMLFPPEGGADAYATPGADPDSSDIFFTEPTLAFDFRARDDGDLTVLVTLKGEAAPPSFSHDERWNIGCVLSFDLSRNALNTQIERWERQLDDFPIRRVVAHREPSRLRRWMSSMFAR